ncbi:MAG: hypothetical protein M3Y49_00145 [Actinomycetota bacterium]|nr:hypothetical protein [Actinomycetota bacterium]
MDLTSPLPERARVRGTVINTGGKLRMVPSTGPDVPLGRGPYWVSLTGASLPPEGTRVCARGHLSGRSLHLTSWAPEPEESAGWSTYLLGLHGAGADVVDTMSTPIDDVEGELPPEWPIIMVGNTVTGPGRAIQTLEVDHLTPAIQEWARAQSAGALRLVVFIEDNDC